MILESIIEALMLMCIATILFVVPVGFVMLMISQFEMAGLIGSLFLLVLFSLTFIIYVSKS